MPDPSGHMTEKEFAADVAAGKNEWEKTKPTTSTRGSGQSGSYVENGQVWMDVPELDEFGDPTGKMIPKRVDRAPGWGSGSGHSNDALVAAQAALSGFLQAQTLADARKSAAMDQFQKLSQWAVPDDAKYAPNFEPGGLANEAAAVAGMQKFMPPRLQTAKINAGSIQNPGQVPKEILDMIGAVRGAASQGKG